MLMAHECLTVAATLGHFHHWQRWVELAGRDKPDWMKVPTVSAGTLDTNIAPHLTSWEMLSTRPTPIQSS